MSAPVVVTAGLHPESGWQWVACSDGSTWTWTGREWMPEAPPLPHANPAALHEHAPQVEGSEPTRPVHEHAEKYGDLGAIGTAGLALELVFRAREVAGAEKAFTEWCHASNTTGTPFRDSYLAAPVLALRDKVRELAAVLADLGVTK